MPTAKNKLLVTGGAGFIGSEFVRQGVAKGYPIVVVDKLTYAGDLSRLAAVRKDIKFYKTDICHGRALAKIFKTEKPATIVHFAAETHVDRSIQDAAPFLRTNILGTQALINLALQHRIASFIHISSDEVYGEIRKGSFTETSALNPGNPYSASKASAELLINAARRTYQLPAIIIRPSNNYGPWQYPEKLIPLTILKALHNQRVPVYATGTNVREWLHVSDCASGILCVLEKGKAGEIYNISSGDFRKNIHVVCRILKELGQPESLIQFVKDRPGHDFRYAIDSAKTRRLGWKIAVPLAKGLPETVSWCKENLAWMTKVRGKKA